MTHLQAWRHARHHIHGVSMRTYSIQCRRYTLESTSTHNSELVLLGSSPLGRNRGLISTLAASTPFRRHMSTSDAINRSLEKHLLDSMRALARSESFVNREAVWGAYRRVGDTETGFACLSHQTVIRLIELSADDPDKQQALLRINSIVDDVTRIRQLLSIELDAVKRACNIVEGSHRHPALNTRVRSTNDAKHSSDPGQTIEATIPERDELPALPATFLRRVDEITESDLPGEKCKTETLLEEPLITLDTALVWRAYLLDLETSIVNGESRLSHICVHRLIAYCSQLGAITGAALLKWIEMDAEAHPWIFPDCYTQLIVAYAKLGMLGHSRRCHRDGIAALEGGNTTDVDWSLCIALLRSSRQKEAHVIFRSVVAAGWANSRTYTTMIKEYTLMRNPDAAFALFDDVCKVGFAPTYTMLCALGTSAALYKDASKSSECLQKVITCLNNWSFTVECRFFASVLTGYDQSQQYTLFDALAGKLLDRFQHSNEYLNQVIMASAAKRGDDELMCKLAPMELQNIRKYPRFEKFAQHLWQSKELQSVLDISRFPENNLTANMKLSQDIDNVEMSLAPETLVCRTLDMIEKGYTPSFRLFARLIRRLSVCGSNDLAIETFEKLSAAGVPSSIELLLLLHTLYLHSSDGERAIAIFEAIRARLTPSDFGDITLHAPTMRKYVLFLLDRGEVSAAYDVVAFLHTLPCDHKELPYSTLIEYCISHRMLENSYDMIAHVVQHDISIEPRVINLCFHLLEKNESATDYANFLRYVSRIDMMDFVPDSAFETFFLRSMQGRKISDIEWAVDVLANAPYEVIGIWRVILKRLSKSTDDRTVIAIVRMAIDFATNKERTGMDLLAAAAGMSETLVVVADSVLVALREHDAHRDRYFYTAAFSIFARLWSRYYAKDSPFPTVNPHMSSECLVSAFRRHIHDAAKIGIDGSLLSIALRAVASSSLLSIGSAEYIDILESVPDTELSVNPYEAVCAGLAQRGHIREVETVLDNMLMRGLALNANMLNIIMSCFIHAPPPPQSPKLVKDDYRSGHAEPKTAEGIETDTMDDGGYMHIDESDDLLLTVLDHEMNQTEIGDSSGRSEFYENALSKVVSFWKQFEFRGLSPDRSSYSVLLYAYIKAQKFTEAEIIINDIVEMGLEHNNYTATQWIVLRLKQDDVKGALSVLDAIGNKERCDELLQTDKRYIGLQHVQRNAFHFLPFVTHHLDNGKHAVAVEMLLAMHTLHLKATAKAYHDILVYLANEDSRQAFLDVVQQMVKFDILINSQIADVLRDYSAGKNTK